MDNMLNLNKIYPSFASTKLKKDMSQCLIILNNINALFISDSITAEQIENFLVQSNNFLNTRNKSCKG